MPSTAKIDLVLDGEPVPSALVSEKWKSAQSLLKADVQKRGWLADVLKFVEQQFSVFTLPDLYSSSEDELQRRHPENRNVRPKIRQQLQYLRDLGFVEFVKLGVYRCTKSPKLSLDHERNK